jgi:predicted YcjX-like family ATPase
MLSIDAAAGETKDQKKAALRLMLDAFAEADLDGIDLDCMAQAALFAALQEFVATYGEDPVARFAERLPERIRNGEFTVVRHA